jgi:hypothetical protein
MHVVVAMEQDGPSQSQDDRVQKGDLDQVEKAMETQVQLGESLLTSCFEQEDRGEIPDWEQVRGLPGR